MDKAKPAHDWYLREWLDHFGKKQAHLARELGWTRGRAHYVWHGETQYTREIVDQVAAWLNLEPYELLMPPAEALALRQLRETARVIVAGDRSRSKGKAGAPSGQADRNAAAG